MRAKRKNLLDTLISAKTFPLKLGLYSTDIDLGMGCMEALLLQSIVFGMASGLSIITAGYFITVIIWTKVLKSIIPTRTMTSGMIKVVHVIRCEFKSTDPQTLKNHKRKHSEDYQAVKYDCDVCNRVFSSKNNLKRHQQTAHDES